VVLLSAHFFFKLMQVLS